MTLTLPEVTNDSTWALGGIQISIDLLAIFVNDGIVAPALLADQGRIGAATETGCCAGVNTWPKWNGPYRNVSRKPRGFLR